MNIIHYKILVKKYLYTQNNVFILNFLEEYQTTYHWIRNYDILNKPLAHTVKYIYQKCISPCSVIYSNEQLYADFHIAKQHEIGVYAFST